jgi:hypothetical protein
MANTGFTTRVNGVETDLIKIFAPLSGTRLTYNTNYVTSDGKDLRDIFEPYVAGDATANPTKYTTLSGGQEKDLNVIFGIPPPPYPIASNVMPLLGLAFQLCIYGKNVIVTNQNRNVYYSTNYGTTFTIAPSAPSPNTGSYALSFYGTNAIITYNGSSNTGGVYTSSNSGANWTKRMNLSTFETYCSIYENYAMIAIGTTIIYLSNDYGVSWNTISITGAKFTSCAISFDSTTNKYIAICCSNEVTPGIYYCTNFTGVSSTTTFTKGTTNMQVYNQNAISLVGRNGIAVTNGASPYSGLWYTNNGGQTWSKSVNYSTVNSFYNCSLSATGLGIAWKNDGGNAQYITRDYGVTWTTAIIFPATSFAFALYNNILVSGRTLGGIVDWGTYT